MHQLDYGTELLIGVHLATTEQRRERRRQFVAAILSKVSILGFSIEAARRHAEVYADLSWSGQMIGAHDLIIAATALQYDFALHTDNVAEFQRGPGLRGVPFE